MINMNQKNLDATQMSICRDHMAHRTVIKGTLMDTNSAQVQPRQPGRRHQVLFSLQTNTVTSVSLSPEACLRGMRTKWRQGWKAPACLWWFLWELSLCVVAGVWGGWRAFSPMSSCISQLLLQGVECVCDETSILHWRPFWMIWFFGTHPNLILFLKLKRKYA